MESSNYDQTLLTTGQNLSRIRKSRLGHLSGKRLDLLGLVRLPLKEGKRKIRGESRRRQTRDA
jgi:hypothetical protein